MPENKQPRPRRTYTSEFKQQLVDLFRSGKRKCDIVREYDIASSLLDKWIAQTDNTGSFKEKDNRTSEEQKDTCNESKVENVVNREFDDQPYRNVVVSDLTYVRVGMNWNYFKFFTFLFSSIY